MSNFKLIVLFSFRKLSDSIIAYGMVKKDMTDLFKGLLEYYRIYYDYSVIVKSIAGIL